MIGVVVGVGGALILGGVAFVLLRLYRQRQNRGDEDDILMGGAGAGHEKNSHDRNPFRNNLDQYHNPAGQVNTASNF